MINEQASTTYAIIELTKLGFDNEARTLHRKLIESCLLTLAVITDKSKAHKFFESREDDSRESYDKNFRAKKLMNSVISLQQRIKLDKELSNEMNNIIHEDFLMNSKAVHNSYISIGFGTPPYTFDEDLAIRILGKINFCNFFFLVSFTSAFESIHKIKIHEFRNMFWGLFKDILKDYYSLICDHPKYAGLTVINDDKDT